MARNSDVTVRSRGVMEKCTYCVQRISHARIQSKIEDRSIRDGEIQTACQNACPVYRQTGGHAYGSVYAGPIGAILTPQLQQMHHAQSLPYASSLCGACYEVCPVKINIPEVLIHLRNKVVVQKGFSAEAVAMKAMAAIFRSERRFRAAQRLGRVAEAPLVRKDGLGGGWIEWLPGLLGGWTQVRDLQEMPKETFRDWWEKRESRGN